MSKFGGSRCTNKVYIEQKLLSVTKVSKDAFSKLPKASHNNTPMINQLFQSNDSKFYACIIFNDYTIKLIGLHKLTGAEFSIANIFGAEDVSF